MSILSIKKSNPFLRAYNPNTTAPTISKYGNIAISAPSKPAANPFNILGNSFNGFNMLPNIIPKSLIAVNGAVKPSVNADPMSLNPSGTYVSIVSSNFSLNDFLSSPSDMFNVSSVFDLCCVLLITFSLASTSSCLCDTSNSPPFCWILEYFSIIF